MITESRSRRQKRLHEAALIVGLAGVAVTAVFFVAIGEAPFASLTNFMYAIPNGLIFSIPFLVIVVIAWKWPDIGGILLIMTSLVIAGMLWPLWRQLTMPISWPTYATVLGVLPVSLLPLISGILFLLSWRRTQGQKLTGETRVLID